MCDWLLEEDWAHQSREDKAATSTERAQGRDPLGKTLLQLQKRIKHNRRSYAHGRNAFTKKRISSSSYSGAPEAGGTASIPRRRRRSPKSGTT